MASVTSNESKPAQPSKYPSQAVTGLIPPSVGEARIREVWPSLLGVSYPLGMLGARMVRTFILAPIGILLLAPLFKLKFFPFICKRYTLTNRRLMIQRGWKPAPVQEVALADIDEVKFDPASIDSYFLSADVEIISKGQTVMTLSAVPEPEGFRLAIINAVKAWVPGKATGPFLAASAVK